MTTNTTSVTTGTLTWGTATGPLYVGYDPAFKPRKRWWYKMYIRECPLCHRKDIMREKQDYPRPENREDRVLHEFVYDYCG